MSLAVRDKASNVFRFIVFRFPLRGVQVLQESGESRTPVAVLEASGTEHLGRIDTLESRELKLVDKNPRLEHQMATARVEKERHEARDMEITKAVTDAKV